MAEAEGPEGPEAEAVWGSGGLGRWLGWSEWSARGLPGVQNYDIFLVHPYARRTVLGDRWYPHKHPPGVSMGKIVLAGLRSLSRSRTKTVLSAGLGWAG